MADTLLALKEIQKQLEQLNAGQDRQTAAQAAQHQRDTQLNLPKEMANGAINTLLGEASNVKTENGLAGLFHTKIEAKQGATKTDIDPTTDAMGALFGGAGAGAGGGGSAPSMGGI